VRCAARAGTVWQSRRWLEDVSLLAALVVVTAVAQPHLRAPDTLVGLDTATQYYPWYAFLGQSLIAGHIPGWNPATFAGTPFAADPLSGWTYVPAMVLFGILPLAQAARALLIFHPLLAAWSAYAFARTAGLTRLGAFVTGLAYANSGFLQIQNLCCSPVASIYAWLPLTLLGVERALRSTGGTARAAWWGLAGLGVSQAVAVWPGQGAYYAALLVGGYIAYRTLLARRTATKADWRARVSDLLQHELGVFALGTALAAAGLLPRVEFNTLSDLAGGYAGANLNVGGLQPSQWWYLAYPGGWYVGLSVLALAGAAPFMARGPTAAAGWFFGITSLVALFLTGTVETPLHWLLYHLLPGFASLHPHAPERILTVAYLGPALLAGATTSAALCPSGGLWAVSRSRVFAAVGAALVVGLVTVDLAVGGAWARAEHMLTDPRDGIDRITPVDLATSYRDTEASQFLRQRLAESPSRFLGYAPTANGRPLAYTFRFADPGTAALLVNNEALPLGLQDVQGYDASHLHRYDAYLVALNGQTQDYHDATVFASGLSSPLLDLLNVRYLVVPADPDALEAAALDAFPEPVYADAQVRILENPRAYPRAWIVHTAAQAPPGGAASLRLIADRAVDARQTAVLEEPPPPLASPADPSLDRAPVLTDEPNRLDVRTSTTAAGLLVLSEIDYPAWKAYVDGQPVHLFVADGALRAVPVPAGEHTVELRFESETLRIGLLVSSAAAALVATFLLLSLMASYRTAASRRRPASRGCRG
jgi:hypothetical protein